MLFIAVVLVALTSLLEIFVVATVATVVGFLVCRLIDFNCSLHDLQYHSMLSDSVPFVCMDGLSEAVLKC